MRRSTHPGSVAPLLLSRVVSGALLAVPLPQPATANVLPESAILIHVQDVSEQACVTAITHCDQIIRTTTEQGLLEFLLFFYPVAYEAQHYGILEMTTSLTIPGAWQIVGWAPCTGGLGDLSYDGSSYPLHLSWPDCPTIAGQLLLVARVLVDVRGPGRMDFEDPYNNEVRLRCEAPFTSIALGVDAEAGMDCEFTRHECARGEYCTPVFSQVELQLEAPAGGSDEGELPFTAMPAVPGFPCGLSASSGAAWASAAIVQDWPEWAYRLVVTADAASLEAGSYETWIQVVGTSYGGVEIAARCIQVLFEVRQGASVLAPGIPVVERRSWGWIKESRR